MLIHSHYKWHKTYVLYECGLPCEECVCLVLICACFLCRELHVAQMVEHLLSIQEALGLMPIFSHDCRFQFCNVLKVFVL